MLKRWAPWAALGIYGLLLLAVTVRAWLKFDGETAAKLFGVGLVLLVVLWRAWPYALAVLFGGQSQFSSIRVAGSSSAPDTAGTRRKV
jgi:hypothetical protein